MTDQVMQGRVALVTGSSRGIGRAVAQRLAAAGATVAVHARSAGATPAARGGAQVVVPGTVGETVDLIESAAGKAFAVTADLSVPSERAGLVDRVIAEAGRIDILVNNAGFADYSTVEEMSPETFDSTLDQYLRTPFVLAQKVIPHMAARGDGWIVNIGSVTAVDMVRPFRDYNKTGGDVVYASAKAALHRFTQGLAAELVDRGIAVNAVGPSTAIRTPGADALIPSEFPAEPVEYLAETVLAMCHLPAADRTGLVTFSLHYPWSSGLPVHTLDGVGVLPPLAPPEWANPNIKAGGV